MANRHLSRSVALQSLFEWDFRGQKAKEIPAIIARSAKEFAPGLTDLSFIEELVKGIVAKIMDFCQWEDFHWATSAAMLWPNKMNRNGIGE